MTFEHEHDWTYSAVWSVPLHVGMKQCRVCALVMDWRGRETRILRKDEADAVKFVDANALPSTISDAQYVIDRPCDLRLDGVHVNDGDTYALPNKDGSYLAVCEPCGEITMRIALNLIPKE